MTNKWTQTDGWRDTPMFSGSDFLAIKNPEIYKCIPWQMIGERESASGRYRAIREQCPIKVVTRIRCARGAARVMTL